MMSTSIDFPGPMSYRILTAFFLLLAVVVSAKSQDNLTIVEQITAGGRNTIVQPEALAARLERRAGEVPEEASTSIASEAATRQRVGGYRIQIFLDNNPRTAKGTARSRANAVAARFPELRTYVTYNSPYWRTRVGDFRSQAEATAKAEELRHAFPGQAKEIRVVRDNINLSAN